VAAHRLLILSCDSRQKSFRYHNISLNNIDPTGARSSLRGPLTVRWNVTIQNRLLQALTSYQWARIECIGAENVHVSIIQFVLAARKPAQQV
jgi:hypothetical protein